MFDIPGHVAGLADFWGIQDHGIDNLGQGRSAVPPEASYRYRLFWQHRELLPYDLQLSAELGWISDRNFLEEYYKSEWDELKDETTGVELKQHHREQLLEHHGRLPHQRLLHRRPTGCRGPTTSGWGNRCSATPSPGTSTPTSATPSSGRRPCRRT